MVAISFTFYSLELLNKIVSHHSTTKLNAKYLIRIRWLLLYLIIEKIYIEYDKGLIANVWL